MLSAFLSRIRHEQLTTKEKRRETVCALYLILQGIVLNYTSNVILINLCN